MFEDTSSIAAARPVPRTALSGDARIIGVGTMTGGASYSQQDLLDGFGIADRRVRGVFLNSGIQRRFLALPTEPGSDRFAPETQGQLLAKHRMRSIEFGSQAISACLAQAGVALKEIAYLCCVTTTGFSSPGLSARICKALDLAPDCVRLDVVGMGCNAGLNALNAATSWARVNPGRLGVMLCAEICSAAYVTDDTMRTAVVNSLFGDGAAAIAFRVGDDDANDHPAPAVLRFNSRIVLDALEAMRYDWDEGQGKFSFFLDPEIPYVVGANVEVAIDGLLAGTGLCRSDISHWIVHSGGKKVIDAVRVNLGLSAHDLRHTTGVLRDYGNLSSGSFLFSLGRLQEEDDVVSGDYGIMMTMGPGSSIETALLQW
jgi:3,5-dihydroxyphenylacetyl-CoA synthase